MTARPFRSFFCEALLLSAALLFGGPIVEGRAETVAQVVHPKQTGGANNWVSDGAHVLDAATERRLNVILGRVEKQTRAEMNYAGASPDVSGRYQGGA